MILLIFLGIILFLIGIVLIIRLAHLKKVCTIETQGIVIDIVKTKRDRTLFEREIRGYSRTSDTIYSPVFKYYADGHEIIKKSIFKGSSVFRVGDKVTLFYNPNNIENYYVVGYHVETFSGIFFAIVGAVFLFAGIIVYLGYF